MEAFKDAWLGLRKSGGDLKERKRRTLEWCLFEAVRDKELEFLAKATCISIMLDERNGRLLITKANGRMYLRNPQSLTFMDTPPSDVRVLEAVDIGLLV